MQDALASVSDLALLMKTSFAGNSPEEAQATFILQMASAWARGIARKLWATPDDITEWRQDTVVGIVLASARRELTNPRRATYEVHGPDSASYNAAACPPGFFTEEETKYLLSCRGSTGSWWVMETYRDDPCTTAGYLNSSTSRKPFPMYAPYDTEGWQNSFHL